MHNKILNKEKTKELIFHIKDTTCYSENCTLNNLFLENYEVDFQVEVDSKQYRVFFQNEERKDGMKAYTRFGMAPANFYGLDDDYENLRKYCEEKYDYDMFEEMIDVLNHIANREARDQLDHEEKQYVDDDDDDE